MNTQIMTIVTIGLEISLIISSTDTKSHENKRRKLIGHKNNPLLDPIDRCYSYSIKENANPMVHMVLLDLQNHSFQILFI